MTESLSVFAPDSLLSTLCVFFDRSVCTRITDIEIHFLQIKFTAIGVYLDSEIVGHLQQWKGKTGKDLAEDDDFFEALISGEQGKLENHPVEFKHQEDTEELQNFV